MSRGFAATSLPDWVLSGIESAFEEWMKMSGEWLKTAPEYLLTVMVAQNLVREIHPSQRTLLMEPHVARTLADAGGVQRGPKAAALRAGGRYDIVLGHGNGLPRAVIELKNPLWDRGAVAEKDLRRICESLLHGKASTQLYTGLFAFYTSSGPPASKDETAKDRLQRKWGKDWEKELREWSWAGRKKATYSKHLHLKVTLRVREVLIDGESHAWAAVCVQITRKPTEA